MTGLPSKEQLEAVYGGKPEKSLFKKKLNPRALELPYQADLIEFLRGRFKPKRMRDGRIRK